MTDEERDALMASAIEKKDEKKFKEAIAELDKVIKEYPEDIEALFHKCVCYDGLGNYIDAIKGYDQLISLNKEVYEPLNNRAVNYIKTGEYNKAIEDLNEALKLEPNNAVPRRNLGFAYYWQKNYVKAEENFETAIELDKTNASTYYGSAYCKTKLAQKEEEEKNFKAVKIYLDKAKIYFDKAIKLEPELIDAHWERGLLNSNAASRKSACIKNLRKVFSHIIGEYSKKENDYPNKSFFIFMPIDADHLASLATSYLWLGDPSKFNDPLDVQPLRLHIEKELKKYPEAQEVLNSIRIRSLADGSDVETVAKDSKLLWSHYANSHKGMLIEIKFTPAFFAFKRIGIRKVAYSKVISDIGVDGIQDIIAEYCFTKSKEWEYEHEYRLIALVNDLDGETDAKNKLDKKYFSIQNVCFGFKTPLDHKRLVYTILSKNYSDEIDYYEVKQSSDEARKDPFSLQCTKINKPGNLFRSVETDESSTKEKK